MRSRFRTGISPFPHFLISLLVLGGWAWAAAPYADPVELGRVNDPRLKELSGLAASTRNPGVFFAHNDSGDGPTLYALNRRGELVAVLHVQGAHAFDWEDMAAGPGPDRKPALYLGDIGDNLRARPFVSVFRVPEPAVDPKARGKVMETAPAARFDLSYEDGPQDAETLLVHPKTGALFVVTKSRKGSAVYAAPQPLKPGPTQHMRKVAELDFGKFPESDGAKRDAVGALLATGGAIAPKGDRLVVRTYTDAHEWTIPRDDVVRAFRGEPLHVPLPPVRAGEAITYTRDGEALVVVEEGEKAPLFELRRSGTR